MLVVVVEPSVAVAVEVRVQSAPATRPVQASTWTWEGVQRSVPLATVAEAMVVASDEAAAAVAAVVSDDFPDCAQPGDDEAEGEGREGGADESQGLHGVLPAAEAAMLEAGGAGRSGDEKEGARGMFPAMGYRAAVPPRQDLDALIKRAQAGEVRAFEALIAAELPRVRRYARAFHPSEPDADDLAQEALLRVYRGLRSFRYQSAFSTWLFTVVRTTFLDGMKGRAGTRRALEEPLRDEHREHEGGERPDDALAGAQDRQLRLGRPPGGPRSSSAPPWCSSTSRGAATTRWRPSRGWRWGP